MTPREQNKKTREDHERLGVYDWALDLEINPDFAKWAEELSQAHQG
jgi:hypothetical protein